MKWIYIFSFLAYYVSVCLIQNKIFSVKPQKHIALIGSCCFLLTCGLFHIKQIPMMAVASFSILFALPIYIRISLYRAKLRSILSTYFFVFCVCVIVTATIVYYANVNDIIGDGITTLIMTIVCFICCYSKISLKIQSVLQWTPLYVKRLILVVLFFSAITITLMFEIQDNANNVAWLNLTYTFFAIVIILICTMVPILVATTISNKMLNHQALHYKTQIEEQAKHYEAVAKSNWEIRRFQHDTKNLTVGLTNLLETGQQKEAMEMLNSYYNASLGLKDALLQFDTGNGIVDALLADKQQTACAINTQIQFEGMVPAKGISPSDLCVLFGNTLDNALDACGKFSAEEEKTIRIVSKSMGGYLWLTVQNPVVENVKIKNNTIATTKEDKHHHGFGLHSLQLLAQKHDGELQLTCENNLFEIAIELNLESKNNL